MQDDCNGAFVLNVAVDRPRRRCGQASRLLEFVIDHAVHLGAERLYTDVDSHNEVRAILFQQLPCLQACRALLSLVRDWRGVFPVQPRVPEVHPCFLVDM
jgi:GNAT superfamily N-acetyltransferase